VSAFNCVAGEDGAHECIVFARMRAGRRALDFVLKNQGMIDKTLLFDIEVIKIK
jgi:hypothetical protein